MVSIRTRGATSGSSSSILRSLFQSTLPAGGATILFNFDFSDKYISIHAPRGGSDHRGRDTLSRRHISIHAPRGGSDPGTRNAGTLICYFNPRSPRGERQVGGTLSEIFGDFNPRSPRGERHKANGIKTTISDISIHAPRGGSDVTDINSRLNVRDFNPRSPRGERLPVALLLCFQTYFNPRSPRGERLQK